MPRTYIKKKNKTYTSQDLATAIQKVRNGELTAYAAAQMYKIPMTTLHDHVKTKDTLRQNAGRPTVLPVEDEKKLASTIIVMEKWGFGLSRSEILEIVAEYVRVNNIQTPFKNNTPGPDWFINFRKRHGLSIKKAQPVEYVRRKMTDPFVIAEYFDLLNKTLKDLSLLENPESIWNLDETSLCLDPTKTKVVGKKNKPCARTTYGSGKENITVLAGASASGKKLPPLIIFKGKFVWDQWMADLNKDDYDFELTYAASTKGWMESEIFHNYFEKVLIPSLGEKRPALIIYDGHSTHVDARVVELAVRNNITIIKLPPHTSHLLQPLDISVFKSFKAIWDAKLVEWQRRNVGTKMPKNVFAKTMADTWQQTNPEVIKSGFKKAGIYPFNANVIPIDKYDPDAYQRYKKTLLTHTLNQPKTLKEICIESFNNQFATANETIEITDNNYVALLSEQSRNNAQMLPFEARHPSQVPVCLQNSMPTKSKINIISNIVIKKASQIPLQYPSQLEPSVSFEELPEQSRNDTQILSFEARHPSQVPACLQNSKPTKSKINIISNIVIKKASQVPLQNPSQLDRSVSFEELLLRKIQQDKKNCVPTKKKRVTKGAEVITADLGKKILEEVKETKSKKIATKTSKAHDKRKRKREPSSDTTSISDIISNHSDSDIIDCIDFEDLDDCEDNFNLYQEETSSQKSRKDRKCVINMKTDKNITNEKVLTDKTTNYVCSKKGKGIGKKSKGKENQVDKKKEKEVLTYFATDKEDINEQIAEYSNEKQCGIPEKCPLLKECYDINDTVLVRYFIRNKWKYYVGFIGKITKHGEHFYYLINFLKTTRQQQHITFIEPKKKDTDEIPESLLVKKIELQKKIDQDKEYYLIHDEDTIYFD
ncbi:uncharacterized protein LOC111356860 [Spodoptera litura]|uniref:Uncharacterized protein LOC111356860 n=1 Tax=Spodoptera litura TaxID=69820 RepID=A0A9J7IVD1_SPOLT|nr:uncharacterized protein LOC111356860 [Spodoptera litura]